VVVLLVTVLTDILNGPIDPPAYLVGLCGAAGSALFGAASSDKAKREKEVSATAIRAESKADDALGRSDASMDLALSRVIDVQERQLASERTALQAMRDAVQVKEDAGVPVLAETYDSIDQLDKQTRLLAEDIRNRKRQMTEEGHAAHDRQTVTADTANRAEAKADAALSESASSLKRETEWSHHRDHSETKDENDPHARGGS
jgi:hypothetical protein